jgi:hypothetical protein
MLDVEDTGQDGAGHKTDHTKPGHGCVGERHVALGWETFAMIIVS